MASASVCSGGLTTWTEHLRDRRRDVGGRNGRGHAEQGWRRVHHPLLLFRATQGVTEETF